MFGHTGIDACWDDSPLVVWPYSTYFRIAAFLWARWDVTRSRYFFLRDCRQDYFSQPWLTITALPSNHEIPNWKIIYLIVTSACLRIWSAQTHRSRKSFLIRFMIGLQLGDILSPLLLVLSLILYTSLSSFLHCNYWLSCSYFMYTKQFFHQ